MLQLLFLLALATAIPGIPILVLQLLNRRLDRQRLQDGDESPYPDERMLVATFPTSVEASIAEGRLRAGGIRTFVVAADQIGSTLVAPRLFELHVYGRDLRRAQKLLAQDWTGERVYRRRRRATHAEGQQES